nr:immunoglobulin light chain junction region [Macaca mulatta]
NYYCGSYRTGNAYIF